jgi:hypothetical protein
MSGVTPLLPLCRVHTGNLRRYLCILSCVLFRGSSLCCVGRDSSVGWSLGEWVGKPQNGNGLNIRVRYRIKSSRRPWQRWIMWRRNRLVVLTEEWKRKESDFDDVLIRNSVLSNCFIYRRSHGLSEENSAKKRFVVRYCWHKRARRRDVLRRGRGHWSQTDRRNKSQWLKPFSKTNVQIEAAVFNRWFVRGGHSAAGARHWCGFRKLLVKIILK